MPVLFSGISPSMKAMGGSTSGSGAPPTRLPSAGVAETVAGGCVTGVGAWGASALVPHAATRARDTAANCLLITSDSAVQRPRCAGR